MTVTDAPEGALDDYHITCSQQELEALREAVKDADGRKSEVKLAREVLGMY